MFQVLSRIALVCLVSAMFNNLALAEEPAKVVQEKPIRVGGLYIVRQIERLQLGYYQIKFESVDQTGKFDRLILETDHVNFAVRKGSEVRLSAEVLSSKGAEAEIAQVVIFLPGTQGPTPVWMLSRKDSSGELRGSRFLEMHAPSTDYQVF